MKTIRINGIRGIISLLFVATCAFAGFVIFPGFVAMGLWNKYLATNFMFPILNLFQGVLLWGITIISYCLLSKNDFAISIMETRHLSEDELNSIIEDAKKSKVISMKKKLIKSEKFDYLNNLKTKDEEPIVAPMISSINQIENKEQDEISDKSNFNN